MNQLFTAGFLLVLLSSTSVVSAYTGMEDRDLPGYDNFEFRSIAEQRHNPWAPIPQNDLPAPSVVSQPNGLPSYVSNPRFVTPEELERLDRMPEMSGAMNPWMPLQRDVQMNYGGYPNYPGGDRSFPRYGFDPYVGQDASGMYSPYGNGLYGDALGFPNPGFIPLPY